MMTSVTLPSTSGPLHGGYSSVTEETTSSEPEFETPRPAKRCLITTSQSTLLTTDPCKKRRKQSTPIRISSAETSDHQQIAEGKPSTTSSPEPELQCPVCQLYFNTTEQLQNHILSDHSAVECKKEPEEYSTNSQIERPETPLELKSSTNRPEVPWLSELQQNKEWMSPPNLHGLPFNPTNPIFMALPQFAQPESMPRQPIRIFNPDAYCDLCNKEFCNKYFLKTHKANKHGIYSDPPSSSENMINNVTSSYAGTMKLPTSVPSVELSKNDSKTAAAVVAAAAATIINPFNNIFPHSFAASPSSSLSPSTKSLQSKITPKITNIFESSSEITNTSEIVPHNSNGFSSNSESDKVMPDEPQTNEESSSPRSMQQTESTSFNKNSDPDGIYCISQSKMSPGNELDLSNRLRRIGVMNPKAFCEICCKEYCNKYFLRTHKMKRHGIYIPDEKDKDLKQEGGQFPWQTGNMQTSPLNLIMTEQGNVDRKTTSPSDISCELCGIKFQNMSLSQLHNINVHSKHPPKEESHHNQDTDVIIKKELSPTSNNTSEKTLNAEAINEDLQKLQTMILQLNELDVSKTCTTCNACNKEFENRYFLHAHMMNEHGILLDDVVSMNDFDKTTGDNENSSNNNTVCDLCGKDVQNVDEMKKHLSEAHSNQQLENIIKDEFNGFTNTQEKNLNRPPTSSNERRISMNITPTSSYCDICNKELCNKYFMKTHMQRMHGIEIENGAQIGGVICDICNKELCSKYFLRVHKHNTHGIVEYGTSLLQPRKVDGDVVPPQMSSTESDGALKPADLADLSHRYFAHFTEVCSICSRRFRSTKWLKAHLLSDHGQVGAEKWAELEQQLQQNVSHIKVKSERNSPTLKIPNGGGSSQTDNQKIGNICGGTNNTNNNSNGGGGGNCGGSGGGGGGGSGIQNVLSSLFSVDETTGKSYQCSYCPFNTPLLPLLFVHERSHSMSSDGVATTTSSPIITTTATTTATIHTTGTAITATVDTTPPCKCPVCGQNFPQSDILQHHIFTCHPFLPLPPFFNGNETIINDIMKEPSESAEDESKEDNLKKRKGGKGVKRELTPEVGASLKDLAKRAQVPATYALPQLSLDDSTTGYVMQAFLMEEAAAPDKRVVPAVVFLPVFQKQPAPLTVTFTLTPA